jgi:hypothetical protein
MKINFSVLHLLKNISYSCNMFYYTRDGYNLIWWEGRVAESGLMVIKQGMTSSGGNSLFRRTKPPTFPTKPNPALEKAVFSPLLGQNFRKFVIFCDGFRDFRLWPSIDVGYIITKETRQAEGAQTGSRSQACQHRWKTKLPIWLWRPNIFFVL